MKESTAIQIKEGWIVDVSSEAYHVVCEKLELSDLHFKKDRKYDPWVGSLWTIQVSEYDILFIKELADQVEGSNICCLSLHTSRSDRYWSQQTSRSSHLSLMFSYHSLFVTDTNPSQGAATTITAVCFDPSILRYRAAEKRDSSLSEVTARSSIDPNEHCQDASKALRNQSWELSSEKEIKVELQ